MDTRALHTPEGQNAAATPPYTGRGGRDEGSIASSPNQQRGSPPDAFRAELENLAWTLAAHLEYFEALGLTGLPGPLEEPDPAPAPRKAASPAPLRLPDPSARPARRPGGTRQVEPAASETPAHWAGPAATLEELAERVDRCQGCPLAGSRPVPPSFGRGSAAPLLAVVGPTPTMYEGEAGVLLTAMLEKGLELSPDDYYLTTLVKCRPPDDETPPPGADAACRPVLRRELELLAPKIVLALGKKPGQELSGLAGEPLGLLRPRTHTVAGLEGLWLRVTYGLEDILASPKIKAGSWQDLLRIKPGLLKLRAAGRNNGNG